MNAMELKIFKYLLIRLFQFAKETILNLQLLKSKIEKLTWVDGVITVIDVPLLKALMKV